MTIPDKLLPCPFCGKAVSLDAYDCDDGESAYEFFQIVCKNGCATFESRDSSDITKNWNTRHVASSLAVPGDVGELIQEFNRFVGCFQYDENKRIGARIIAALTQLSERCAVLEQERDSLCNIIGVARCPSDGRHFVAECIQAQTCGCSIGLVVAAGRSAANASEDYG